MPGSSFKVLTTMAILDSPNVDKEYNCKGSAKIDGYILKDYSGKPHGK